MHKKDKILLERIKSYFGVGEIFQQGQNALQYRVSSIKDIVNIIIPHFKNYPLISQKCADFELFQEVVNLIQLKRHLTINGLQEILNIKAAMNMGVSDALKLAFPNIKPVDRSIIHSLEIPDPN